MRPVKRVLPATNSAYGELLIEASDGIAPASWDDIVEGIPTRTAKEVAARLSELWGLPPSIVETLLLPLVGSIPWHGRPAGLDLYLEVEGWSLGRYRSFLSGLLDLVPDWVGRKLRASSVETRERELVSGAKIRLRSSVPSRPFSVLLRSISAAPAPDERPGSPPRSLITFGKALTSEFESILSAGQTPLLLSTGETGRLSPRAPEIPDALRAAVWGLHWWTPEAPDAPEWYRWLRASEPRLRRALDEMPKPASFGPADSWSDLLERREFRDRLAQAAFSRARLRGAPEVEETDLDRAVDALIQGARRATEWAREGRGPLSRPVDRTEGGRTTRLRRTLEALFQERPAGVTLEEAKETLRSRGFLASDWDVENQLERLRIRGLLFQDRSGRYRVA